jgi:MFS family permease
MMKKIWAPLISLSFLMLGSGFFVTFVSAYLHFSHHSSMMIGVVQGAYYAGFLVAALKIEGLIQRIRHIRAFSFFASILTVATLLQALFLEAWMWVILRFIAGICIAALYIVIESWLLITTKKEQRGVVLGIYMIFLYASQSAAQFIMDFVVFTDMTPYLVTAILSALSILPVSFTYTAVPDLPQNQIKNLMVLLKVSPLGFGGCFISGVVLAAIYAFLPIYAQDKHLMISHVMSVTLVGGFLLQWPFGHLSDIFDRRKTLLLIMGFTAVVSALMIFPFQSHWMIFFLLFLLGGATFTIYPVSTTQVCDRFQSHDITKVTGALLFVYSFGAVIGPLMTPLFLRYFALNGLFIQIFMGSLFLLLVGIYAGLRYKPIPKEDQNLFMPLSGQTPLNYELDPRRDGKQDDEV